MCRRIALAKLATCKQWHLKNGQHEDSRAQNPWHLKNIPQEDFNVSENCTGQTGHLQVSLQVTFWRFAELHKEGLTNPTENRHNHETTPSPTS
mmetsp:Transcript_92575/g.297510  ORF Transcript_92575/g.297510 Transcript_92575/m.297510 type:complete len:93 (-) Transcript_92575:43-321(-)